MQISLKGHTVVVTGGARRLGREIARECARAGANVALTFHASRRQAHEVVAELRDLAPRQNFAALPLEVSHSPSVQQLVQLEQLTQANSHKQTIQVAPKRRAPKL